MEPRWEVIRAAVTIVVCIVLLRVAFIVWRESNKVIVAFLVNMKTIGPNNSVEENNWGMAAFGIVIISVLAVIKILTKPQE